MSSKRRLRRKSCSRKTQHKNQTEAVAHVIQIRRTNGENLHSYRCRFCHFWHVGH